MDINTPIIQKLLYLTRFAKAAGMYENIGALNDYETKMVSGKLITLVSRKINTKGEAGVLWHAVNVNLTWSKTTEQAVTFKAALEKYPDVRVYHAWLRSLIDAEEVKKAAKVPTSGECNSPIETLHPPVDFNQDIFYRGVKAENVEKHPKSGFYRFKNMSSKKKLDAICDAFGTVHTFNSCGELVPRDKRYHVSNEQKASPKKVDLQKKELTDQMEKITDQMEKLTNQVAELKARLAAVENMNFNIHVVPSIQPYGTKEIK